MPKKVLSPRAFNLMELSEYIALQDACLSCTQEVCPYQYAMLLQTCNLYKHNAINANSDYDTKCETKCVQFLPSLFLWNAYSDGTVKFYFLTIYPFIFLFYFTLHGTWYITLREVQKLQKAENKARGMNIWPNRFWDRLVMQNSTAALTLRNEFKTSNTDAF
jgi:hypothetical protein